MVDAEKMSKSLGNFRTIRQTIGVRSAASVDGHPASGESAEYVVNPREAEMLRFFIVRNHYRSAQNYAPDNLIDAQLSLDRLYQTLQNCPPASAAVEIDWQAPQAIAFREAMNDDFNSAGAVAALFDLASEVNRSKDPVLVSQLKALAALLGLLQKDPVVYFQSPTRYTRRAIEQGSSGSTEATAAALSEAEIETLIAARAAAKAAKNFAEADQIRATLKNAGVELDDKPGGLTQWRRA
jgi:cysteinyl-tRNA synthetase